jgi:DNA-binding XRE family transcriptional regulator
MYARRSISIPRNAEPLVVELFKLMREHRICQPDAERVAGLSPSTVSKWRVARRPHLSNFRAFAEACGCEIVLEDHPRADQLLSRLRPARNLRWAPRNDNADPLVREFWENAAKRRWACAAIAKSAGVGRTTFVNWERGVSPRLDNLAAALGAVGLVMRVQRREAAGA